MFHLYLEDNLQQYTAAQIESLIATLPPQRREVAMRYKFLQGRLESAVAYSLLCHGLREQYNIEERPDFVYGEHGKPALAQFPHIHFNLSHCKNAVLCALSDQPVGVDVERIGHKWENVVNYAMNPSEAQQIRQAARPEVEFTRLWTQKEAVFKLRETGITDDVKEILTHCDDVTVETVIHEDKGYAYSVAFFKGL